MKQQQKKYASGMYSILSNKHLYSAKKERKKERKREIKTERETVFCGLIADVITVFDALFGGRKLLCLSANPVTNKLKLFFF